MGKDAEEKRKARMKKLEEERANRDPWLNDPTVLEAEKKFAELKEARRDANAKLEFDLTAQLTKDISAAERDLKKATKKAKKEHKKGGGQTKSAKSDEASDASPAEQIAKIKQELEDVMKQKAAAAESENFKEAKKLKVVQKDLEDKL